ncbi:MAG: pirin family protein [Spongiibacteraceae bacterium]
MANPIVITPHEKDLGGGFIVRRLLPAAALRAVGPFIFFDHFGPVEHRPTDNFDVRPHPHIGLATVTYLFEGAMVHSDNLGYVQRIEPGAINWMTAGRGIAHSERGPEDLRATPYRMHGLQLWCALPLAQEECAPAFEHTPASSIPVFTGERFTVRVLVGAAFGLYSPVTTFVETLYLDFDLKAGADFTLPPTNLERAIYVISGAATVDGNATNSAANSAASKGDTIGPLHMAQLTGAPTRITAAVDTRMVLIGGEALDAHRHIWWNFVSSRKERIEQAKQDWKEKRFAPIPGETEFIPLPE